MVDRGDERIGDAERQHVIDLLRTHTGAGRLTLDEFSDLVGDVFAARTRAELEKVLDGLPPGVAPGPIPDVAGPASPAPGVAAAAPASPAPVPGAPRRAAGAPGAEAQAPRRHHERAQHPRPLAGAGGDHRLRLLGRRQGRPAVGRVIESPVIDVYAWAIMGSVDVVVPPGILVELDGMVLMGGNEDRTRRRHGHRRARRWCGSTPAGMWGGVQARHGRGPVPRSLRPRPRPRPRRRPRRRPGGRGQAPRPAGVCPGRRSRTGSAVPPLPRLPHEVRRPVPPPGPVADDRTNGDRDRVAPVDGAGADAADAASPAAGPRGTLTMMVTDIVGSTRLAEEMGDRRWMDVLAAHNTIVRDAVAHHGGTEIKAQGDGFLLVFSSARSAILAAVDVQQTLAVHRQQHPDQAMDLRIGLHTGEIVDVDGDVFGQNVVIAVRIADHAGPGEILVSGLTRDLTQAGGDLEFDPGRELDLKGLSQPWRVHRVTWTPAPA